MQVFYKCFIQKLYKTVISIVKVKLKITLYKTHKSLIYNKQ